MKPRDIHFEPYVHLAGLTHDRALLAWGGFFFHREDGSERWTLVDDDEFAHLQPGRTESIGEQSESYGEARVEISTDSGRRIRTLRVGDRNHVWVDGLQPDTTYRYGIFVNGRTWLDGQRYDWITGPEGQRGLYPGERVYDCCFRTHPDPTKSVPLTFASFGDYGVGISSDGEESVRQLRIAQALERAVDEFGVRLVVTLGDNIYLGPDGENSGDEDDDWFFTFYQPYRYLLSRIPVYPTVGNHDGADQESSDDRAQLNDNFYLCQRFMERLEAERSFTEPGLFYSFRYGAGIEFISIDTTCADEPYFTRENALRFIEEALCADANRTRWHIPFSHHPMFCAGPEHWNTHGMEDALAPLFKRAGVRLALAGHEHNFQHAVLDGVHYIVSGAGGKLRTDPPQHFHRAHTREWIAQGHFIIVQVNHDRITVLPFAADEHGCCVPLVRTTPSGEQVEGPIVIERA